MLAWMYEYLTFTFGLCVTKHKCTFKLTTYLNKIKQIHTNVHSNKEVSRKIRKIFQVTVSLLNIF